MPHHYQMLSNNFLIVEIACKLLELYHYSFSTINFLIKPLFFMECYENLEISID